MPKGTEFYYSRIIVTDFKSNYTASGLRNLKYIADANGINGDFKYPKEVARRVNKAVSIRIIFTTVIAIKRHYLSSPGAQTIKDVQTLLMAHTHILHFFFFIIL